MKTEAAIEFLQRWRQEPWVLTSISLDKKRLHTQTFRNVAEMRKWIDRIGATDNVYFTVNSVRHDVAKKPSREDIASLDWLHVDIDPRNGEDLQAEQERALELLQNPPEGIPPPTVIVFSGGGYQGFWKLSSPLPIDGAEQAYLEAARYNQALELAFGADQCHNVDRIMRLPGTVNRPDRRKREKGRVEALAEVVEWHDRVYDISQFKPANSVQTGDSRPGYSNVQVSGNVARVDDVNALPVSDLCKVVIVQGTDPDDATRFPSRSEAVFFVCCEMVRGGCDDDTIFAVLTDSDYRISDSIREKRGSADRYAIRQIERAREKAIAPELVELNDKFAVVEVGNRMRVVTERWDPAMRRSELRAMSFEAFREKFMHQRVSIGQDAQGNPKMMRKGHWWLEHPNRREYDSIVFLPGQDAPGCYNLWQGFTVPPEPGNLHERFLEHVYENICGGDDGSYEYVVRWLARAVQLPGLPGETAIVMRGNQGTGKGFFAKHFGHLFGRHYIAVSSTNRLTGQFNAHLRDCCVLFCDEAFWGGDRKSSGALKSLITEDTLVVEPKGVDSIVVPNCLHIMMASNEDWVVPAEMRERRFVVLDAADHRIQDHNYFGGIAQDLRNGGYSHLLHYLTHMDLSGWYPGRLPQTEALLDQKRESLDAYQDWWYHKLLDGRILPEHDGWEREVAVEMLMQDFLEHMQWNRATRATRSKFQNFINQMVPGVERIQKRDALIIGDRTIPRPYYLLLPSLGECRKHWVKRNGEGWGFQPALPASNNEIPF